MCRSSRVNAAMRAGNEAILRRAIQSVARKYAGTRRWTWRHVFRTHSFALREIANGYTGVLDVGATGRSGDFSGGAGRSVSELKALCVMLIHDLRRKVGGQIRI